MKSISKILAIIGFLLFIVSLFLSAVSVGGAFELNGLYAFAVSAGTLYFVETNLEYIKWFFIVLTNVWAVFLFIRFWRKDAAMWLTVLVSVLAISGAISWLLTLNEGMEIKMGYWLWLTSIICLTIANLSKKKSVE